MASVTPRREHGDLLDYFFVHIYVGLATGMEEYTRYDRAPAPQSVSRASQFSLQSVLMSKKVVKDMFIWSGELLNAFFFFLRSYFEGKPGGRASRGKKCFACAFGPCMRSYFTVQQCRMRRRDTQTIGVR